MTDAVANFLFDPIGNTLTYTIEINGLKITDISGLHIHQVSTGAKALGVINPDQDLDDRTITVNPNGIITITGMWEVSDTEAGMVVTDFAEEFNQKDTTQESLDLLVRIHTTPDSGLNDLDGVIQGSGIDNTFVANLQPTTQVHNHNHHNHDHSHSAIPGFGDPSLAGNYVVPSFTDFDRYNENASYNKAPYYEFPRNIGLPLTRNLEFDNFIKAISGNNPLNLPNGGDLPFYTGIPTLDSPNSYQWDSFPAGEAQQFLTVSVDIDKINVDNTPLRGDNDEPVQLESISTSELNRPFTISTTVTPFNAGPIPHIHWAEDEWFILLQGEMDSWVMSPSEDAYDLFEFPSDENGDPLIPPEYNGPPALGKDKVQDFYYAHLTPGQAVFLPRGYAHAYRNISPTGEPLVFLTIWSRDIENGYPEGGIEEFFTLPEPRIGRFYDTSEQAALYGSLYNKTIGSEDANSNQQRFVDYKNVFPDYYVAMSGNFGDFLEQGGNWNPPVYKDYEALPLVPPDFWNIELPQPWNTDARDPNADLYYPAPAPNAPSESVNFSTPFDPQVINRIYITLDNTDNADELESLLSAYSEDAQDYRGNIYSEYYQDPNNPNGYFIIEYWNEYSDVDDFSKTNSYRNFIAQVDQIGTTDVALDTINPSKNSSGDVSDITLVGRFQAKPNTRDEMNRILTELQENTLQEEGALIFEFYENLAVPDQWILFQKYDSGPATTEHFSSSYFKEFDSQFGLLLVGNGVADGSAVFYVTDEPSSSFYELQKQGLETLTNLFTSAPELTVALDTSAEGILTVNNGINTGGIGIVLKFTADGFTDRVSEYGIFSVDDQNGLINGVSPNDTGYLEQVKTRAVSLFSTNVDGFSSVEIDRDLFVETNGQYAFYQVKDGSIFQDNPQIEFSVGNEDFFTFANALDIQYSFQDGSSISAGLSGPVKGFESIIAQPQTEEVNVFDTSTLVTKELINKINVFANTENRPLTFGFYPITDFSGAIASPQDGELIFPDDPRYSSIILADNFEKMSFDVSQLSTDSGSENYESSFMGGKIHAPYFTVNVAGEQVTYFAFPEANPNGLSHIISVGENNFALEDSLQEFDRDFNDLVIELEMQFADPVQGISNSSDMTKNPTLLNDPLYRFRTGNGTYLYVNETERQSILNGGYNFVDEGVAFNASLESQDNLEPIYRFRNTNASASYLYVGEEERLQILASNSSFVEEGLSFYTYGAQSQEETDILRLQTIPGAYMYVTEDEYNSIMAGGFGFTNEGVAFEAKV